MKKTIKINDNDNVIIALEALQQGDRIVIEQLGTQQQITVLQDIPSGHKIAIKPIVQGNNVIKYGFPIGHATQAIQIGEHVHTHNVKTNLGELDEYQYHPITEQISTQFIDRQVNLYRRKNKDVGIRNELWIIPTVSCVNGIAEQIRKQFLADITQDLLQKSPNFDGVYLLSHPYGCSQLGHDHQTTKTILQDMVKHPNAGGVLVIGLGCENNQLNAFKESLGEYDNERVRFMIAQEVEDEIKQGVNYLHEIYQVMKSDQRQQGKLSELKFGLECGGSDGLSGITANPLLGKFSDYIITHGGTSVLTEVPEMFGAETILMSHCINENIFEKTVNMVNNFKQYFMSYNQPIYENPSPGNKAGGITTLEDKSLGCTQKAGNSTVVDVLEYGDRLKKTGLNLLSAPGNDAVATGALAAAGCHMVLFSTGRGTPYGGVVPTVKISTNSALAHRKTHWIDFDAGQLVNGTKMDKLLEQFIDLIVQLVNGKQTCNEINEFRDLSIFKNGVTE
ncbi:MULTISPECIES: UxaA family hydrolase [unclassified Gilliamella]|uniref:UxaA family hydrolase n=1 Tax=unclassified Gilliamella TaxID=2685620 RepID=UPI0013060352|nr:MULTISPECIES: altronate dehydratase family protein [unclassified Gilliamella]MWP49459.1 altronate dehydratase [Gilliamella sp. Lep-s35]MWP69120.1 altronate dehydratase [Gilliamella sp. Lep-s5]MWP77450.1 altronate dehydratase [Gilliamella sp. Lep-s21]